MIKGAALLVLLLYPLVFHFAYDSVGLPVLAVLLGLVLAVRVLAARQLSRVWRWAGAAAVAGFVVAVTWLEAARLLKLYPVLVNAVLLGYGLYTLANPPSAIERLMGRLGVPVSEAGVPYTRAVTALWCGFFAANGAAAAYTAAAQPTAFWALYNGLLSYLLAAGLFGLEYLVRIFYKRRVRRRKLLHAAHS